MEKPASATPENPDHTKALEHIREALRDLKFGEVTITVQDGVVIQIERLERIRLRRTRQA